MNRVKGEKCRLSDLKVGQIGKVLSVDIKNAQLRLHVLEMGFIPETTVTIKKIAPVRKSYSNLFKGL